MRYLGLDIGKKRIGVALSDGLALTAQPLDVLKSGSINKDIFTIIAICEAQEVTEIVAGMPFNMDGSKGGSAEYVEKFLDKLKDRLGSDSEIKISTWDERLSTKAVERVMIEGNARRAERKEKIDALAASFILQGYLDSLHRDV